MVVYNTQQHAHVITYVRLSISQTVDITFIARRQHINIVTTVVVCGITTESNNNETIKNVWSDHFLVNKKWQLLYVVIIHNKHNNEKSAIFAKIKFKTKNKLSHK